MGRVIILGENMSGNKYTVAAVALLAVGTLFVESPAVAQVSISGYTLPMNIALDGALEAVRACTAKGYAVTATVVDVAGTPEVVLRGDHAVIHTKDSSYRKAYTAVSMGPIFHFDRTSQFWDVLAKYPPIGAQSLASTPNVTALPGGVAIKLRDETVAAIGVGGSPGGDKDEACAMAGVKKIESELRP
ncbi:GlcG/HbpS family heme-binding protein [Burkholderia gladioli]|uniref:GlcG/HbpS family heme-binding protein n=2 Tax=Burkholderia gladioli TaxID=28095 RepID=UPI001ABA31A5|nr:heme-binding protein [Burkholderia gladioli]